MFIEYMLYAKAGAESVPQTRDEAGMHPSTKNWSIEREVRTHACFLRKIEASAPAITAV